MIYTKRQIEKIKKKAFEGGLSLGYQIGYQAGIVEGRHQAMHFRSQTNQLEG